MKEVHKQQVARLPHWRKDGAIYAVTFRLSDSIPQERLHEWRLERAEVLSLAEKQKRPLTRDERSIVRSLSTETIEHFLRSGHGACYLREPAIAHVVTDALKCFEGVRYKLFAWCVMPNHAHVVLQPFSNYSLSSILHSWKSFTAKKANALLNRTGAFWQTEYYDHLIRNENDLIHSIEYAWENSEKAGLRHWPWRWKDMEYSHAFLPAQGL